MLKQQLLFNLFIAVLSVLGLFDIIYTFTGASAQLGILYPSAHVLLNIVGFVAISFTKLLIHYPDFPGMPLRELVIDEKPPAPG